MPAGLAALLLRGAGRLPALSPVLGLLESRRRSATLQHRPGRPRPPIAAAIVPDREPGAVDIAIATRLLAAHRAAAAAGPTAPDPGRADLWLGIHRRQARFAQILSRDDPHELAGYLCNVSRHDASQGIIQGDFEHARLTRDRSYRAFIALMTKDVLVSLAEALGGLAPENPAQGAFGHSLLADPDLLVALIEGHIGLELRPPEIDGGLFKLDTSGGLFGERDLNAIFTAHLLRRHLAGRSGANICEIGAGSGRVAYWSHRLGLGSITLVDLPHVNVVQGYYLLRSLPHAPIALYGEPPPPVAAHGLRILPSHAIAADRGHPYDLVLNQDSFPEMHPDIVADYLRWIRSRCHGHLVSINHESKPPYGRGLTHLSLPEAIAREGGFELAARDPYWLRKGYVTEVYRVLQPPWPPVSDTAPRRPPTTDPQPFG